MYEYLFPLAVYITAWWWLITLMLDWYFFFNLALSISILQNAISMCHVQVVDRLSQNKWENLGIKRFDYVKPYSCLVAAISQGCLFGFWPENIWKSLDNITPRFLFFLWHLPSNLHFLQSWANAQREKIMLSILLISIVNSLFVSIK